MKKRFNSTLVQLKVSEMPCMCAQTQCFNSTLVQLKDTDCIEMSMAEFMFQFYLSSIKRI